MTRALKGIFFRSLAITIIKKATISEIVPSQKINCSLNDLHVHDY